MRETGGQMDLIEAMRQMPGCREYDDREVSDDVIYKVLDSARFAPSGGNRQGWRVIVIRDAELKKKMRDLYQLPWQRYVAEHYGSYEDMDPVRRKKVADADQMAETLDQVPIHLSVWVDLEVLAVTDIDANRPSVVAGGSIFPFVQNIQLAARNEGLGTRITTLHSYEEDKVRELLRAPKNWVPAALILMGWPKKLPTKLSRNPVESFAFHGAFTGAPLTTKS